jgi:hypothetical protein
MLRRARTVWILLVIAAVSSVGLPTTASAGPRADGSAASPGWQQESPATSPPGTSWGAMAYDAQLDRVIHFGGSSSTGTSDETWAWDGSTWTQLHPAHHPSARYGHAMAYDPIRQEVVLFGGYDDPPMIDTWIFFDGDWTERTSAVTPLADYASMAFDPNLGQVVIFGGEVHGESTNGMFAWDGYAWSELTPATRPERRHLAGLAYDPERDALVLFGGFDGDGSGEGRVLGDTWTWDGTSWTELDPTRSPTRREGAAMTTFRKRVMVFGGLRPASLDGSRAERFFADTWTLGETGWHKVRKAPRPSPRAFGSAAWDTARKETVIFAGWNGTDTLADTWTLRRQP